MNGDDPEAVVHVARIATEFRQTFKKDVVIDMFCYRRFGHNEGDEPAFTQPLMYERIKTHPTTRTIYSDKLVREGVIARDEPQGMVDEWFGRLEEAFEASKSYKPNKADWLEGAWTGFKAARGYDPRRGRTYVSEAQLKEVGEALCRYPEGFNNRRSRASSKIGGRCSRPAKELTGRPQKLGVWDAVDRGHPVRMSGQDGNRGTFSTSRSLITRRRETYKPLETSAKIKPSARSWTARL